MRIRSLVLSISLVFLLCAGMLQSVHAKKRRVQHLGRHVALMSRLSSNEEHEQEELSFEQLLELDANSLECGSDKLNPLNARLDQLVEFLNDEPAAKLRDSIHHLEHATEMLEKVKSEFEHEIEAATDSLVEVNSRNSQTILLQRISHESEDFASEIQEIESTLFPHLVQKLAAFELAPLQPTSGSDDLGEEIIPKLEEAIKLIGELKDHFENFLEKEDEFPQYLEKLQKIREDVHQKINACQNNE